MAASSEGAPVNSGAPAPRKAAATASSSSKYDEEDDDDDGGNSLVAKDEDLESDDEPPPKKQAPHNFIHQYETLYKKYTESSKAAIRRIPIKKKKFLGTIDTKQSLFHVII